MSKKILIIEDEKPLLNLLAEKLNQEGFKVLTTMNGKEGLNLALKNHPDLILLDIIMPVMDGMTMLGKLRKDSWGKNAQVILLTNLTDTEKERKSRRQGVRDYLIKCNLPVNDIVQKVKEKLK